jgi:hypothetical protein
MNLFGPSLLRRCLGLLLAVVLFSQAQSVLAQAPKSPQWAYAFDLSCRKFMEPMFTKDTKKWGFEVFKDANNDYGVYICEAGNVGVSSAFGSVSPPVKDSKAPGWVYGLDLKARKAGEDMFSDKTKTYGLEVFFDTNSNSWIYIVENGNFAVAPGKAATVSKPENCTWLHSFDLKCRKGGQKAWDKDTPIYGLEIYQDTNNNNLIYISDTGAIAVLPWADRISKSDGKGPEWLHGQDLQSREYGQPNFNEKTKKYGIEIFKDGNNNNVIFLCETGHIAVVTGDKSAAAPTKEPKDAKFKHGLDLSCRKAGEDAFGTKTPTYSIEIYDEPNTNTSLYLSQTGAITGVNKK